jgi:glycosyltransferase involved in cell wall biosynthesis
MSSGPAFSPTDAACDLSIIVPTRQRPDDVQRLLGSIVETATNPGRIEVVLYVDDDDPTADRIEYDALPVRKARGPRSTMGSMLRSAIGLSTGEHIMLTNDDAAFRTSGWDTEVMTCLRRFADGVCLIWCNDLFRRDAIPNFPIFSRRLYEMVPMLIPDDYVRDYVDTHLLDIFHQLARAGCERRVYLDNVVLEHLHVEAGKAQADEVSAKSRGFADELTFFSGRQQRALIARHLARHIAAEAAR